MRAKRALDGVVEYCAPGEPRPICFTHAATELNGALRDAGAHRTTLIPRIRWESSPVVRLSARGGLAHRLKHCKPGVVYRAKAICLDALSRTAGDARLSYRCDEHAIKLCAQHLQMLCQDAGVGFATLFDLHQLVRDVK